MSVRRAGISVAVAALLFVGPSATFLRCYLATAEVPAAEPAFLYVALSDERS